QEGKIPAEPAGGKTGGDTAGMPARFAGRVPGSNSGYYDNAILTPVELGINNDDFIEVISGLREGDEVILPALAASGEYNMQMRYGIMERLGFSARSSSRVNVEQRSGNAGRIR